MTDLLPDGAACCYLLECADGSLYCGWTNRLAGRLEAHQAGKAAKYTRPRRPVRLAWAQACPGRREAMRLEAAVKKLSRAQKLELAAGRAQAPGVHQP